MFEASSSMNAQAWKQWGKIIAGLCIVHGSAARLNQPATPVSSFAEIRAESCATGGTTSPETEERIGETIVAVSSGSGRSAVAVLRISGPQAGMPPSQNHAQGSICRLRSTLEPADRFSDPSQSSQGADDRA